MMMMVVVVIILGRFQCEILEPAGLCGRVSPRCRCRRRRRIETLLIDHGGGWRHFHQLTKFQTTHTQKIMEFCGMRPHSRVMKNGGRRAAVASRTGFLLASDRIGLDELMTSSCGVRRVGRAGLK